MKKYSYEQSQEILSKTNFPDGLYPKQVLTIYYWAIFRKSRFYAFIEAAEKGAEIPVSYQVAKCLKYIKQ